MNFIVVGCGRVGAELCYHLYQSGHQVVVVDIDRESFNRLHPDFRGRTLEGEGLAEGVLERAGIREADGLAAVTNSDTLNAVVAHAARTIYNVSNVVARNYDPNLRSIIEAFGLQTVGSTSWGAQRVEELMMNPTQRMVYSAGNGEVEVYEVQIPGEWNGRTLGELLQPLEECFPVAISKAGKSSLPDLQMELQEGDLLNFSSTFEGMRAMMARLSGKAEA
ncbi:MAG TPA: TrkA family potassium uptake protein [Anaerolineales bacterium]|nr:TrkA family potassium uptake protein [Anaerolineales bacterium]